MNTADFAGLERVKARLGKIANPDATPLMLAWAKIIDEDNRRGIMAGLDKDGVPMAPATYRPRPSAVRITAGQKNHAKAHARRGEFAGYGNHPAGLNNNLTPAEYRRLGGPPLAPRGMFSRVVTNLRFRFARLSNGAWECVGTWDEVVNAVGKKFLGHLFDGKGRFGPIPKRDLRGVRPDGVERCRASLRAWMIDIVRTYGGA
jgi:hypothetical protein